MFPPSIQKLIDIFSKFPTVGRRTSARFVFHLIKMPTNDFDNFITSLTNLKKSVHTCGFCFNPYEGLNPEERLCPICSSPNRNRSILCVIEKENDLISIENTKTYNGLYFILNGALPTLKKEDMGSLRISDLEARIKNPADFIVNNPDFKELIIATNPTAEGEATELMLARKIKNLEMPSGRVAPKITRLARGLPIGGEVEYADEETIANAFENRK